MNHALHMAPFDESCSDIIGASGLVKLWCGPAPVSWSRTMLVSGIVGIPCALAINLWSPLPLVTQHHHVLPWNEPQRGMARGFRHTDQRLPSYPAASQPSLCKESLADTRAAGAAGDLASGTWRDLELTMVPTLSFS